jgi:hypothetical protein
MSLQRSPFTSAKAFAIAKAFALAKTLTLAAAYPSTKTLAFEQYRENY